MPHRRLSHADGEQRHASVARRDGTELQGDAQSFRVIGDDGHRADLVHGRVHECARAQRRDERDLPAVARHRERAARDDSDGARDREHLRAKEAVTFCTRPDREASSDGTVGPRSARLRSVCE